MVNRERNRKRVKVDSFSWTSICIPGDVPVKTIPASYIFAPII